VHFVSRGENLDNGRMKKRSSLGKGARSIHLKMRYEVNVIGMPDKDAFSNPKNSTNEMS